jgi:carbamoyl-phosphate synthase small subunit
VGREAASAYLELGDGTRFAGTAFGSLRGAEGEVVFNTGMVGYVESLTDPSYRGQILALTYPLIGNYGVPAFEPGSERFESDAIQVRALVVADGSEAYGHWEARGSLGSWLRDQGIVGLTGVDTRELTRTLRSRGTMLGRIVLARDDATPEPAFDVRDPNATDLVGEVAGDRLETLPAPGDASGPHVVVVDCGCKRSILRELRARGCRVTRVPYRHDFSALDCDGILLSNGPGDPAVCTVTVAHVARALARRPPVPIAGICLGSQILALAAGGRTYKLPYGHRGQNQPVQQVGTARSWITSQNHGYAVDADRLPDGWEVWFTNLNDGTVEGIRHATLPFFAVQFHPEGSPGPFDSLGFFDLFVDAARHA